MKKPVSLTVHKSHLERQERRAIRKKMTIAAKTMGAEDLVAYVICGIDRHGEAFAAWDTGRITPLWAFPSMVGKILESDCATIRDDYHAPLHRTVLPGRGK